MKRNLSKRLAMGVVVVTAAGFFASLSFVIVVVEIISESSFFLEAFFLSVFSFFSFSFFSFFSFFSSLFFFLLAAAAAGFVASPAVSSTPSPFDFRFRCFGSAIIASSKNGNNLNNNVNVMQL